MERKITRLLLVIIIVAILQNNIHCSRQSIIGRDVLNTDNVDNTAGDQTEMTDVDDSIDDSEKEEEVRSEVREDILYDGALDECDIVRQTGCIEGSWCAMAMSESSCTHHTICVTRTPGTLSAGEECMMGSSILCMPGTECGPIGSESTERTCLEWCREDSDCSLTGSNCEPVAPIIPYRGPCAGIEVTWPVDMCNI